MPKLIDRTGVRYASLTVVSRQPNKGKRVIWRCVCDCGETIDVSASNLVSAHTQSCVSCGRLKISKSIAERNTTHGHNVRSAKRTPTYITWEAMNQRCNNPNHNSYSYYGGRGISICKEWRVFANFLLDMGERPKGKTLDRIDPNGNYEPTNCRWADAKTQGQNRRSTNKF